MSFGKPTTRSLDAILLKWCMWMWAMRLCHNQVSSLSQQAIDFRIYAIDV